MKISENLLSTEFLNQLNQLSYYQRKKSSIGDGGKINSRQAGGHADFHEYRPYRPGDEPRFVDWNIFQRLNKLYVKTFSHQENSTHYLAIDASESMTFDKGSKAKKTCQIACIIAYLALTSGDKVKIFNSGLSLHQSKLFSSKNQIYEMIQYIQNMEFSGTYNFNKLLMNLKEIHSPGMTYVLSDFYEYESAFKVLNTINRQKFHLNLFQILSNKEKNFDDRGYFTLQDSESIEQIKLLITEKVAKQLNDEYTRFKNALKDRAQKLNAPLFQLNAENSLKETIDILRTHHLLS